MRRERVKYPGAYHHVDRETFKRVLYRRTKKIGIPEIVEE
jgi:hypothetical protein